MKYTLQYFDDEEDIWDNLAGFVDVTTDEWYPYFQLEEEYSLKQIRYIYKDYIKFFDDKDNTRIYEIYS